MKHYIWWILLIIIFGWMCIVMPKVNYDWWSFVSWAEYIRKVGLAQVYDVTNYMPISIFAINIWQKATASLQLSLTDAVSLLKIYPLLFDFFILGIISWLAEQYSIRKWKVGLFCLCNLAFWYNSWIWGQFDGVYAFFVLLTIIFLWKKRFDLSMITVMLSINVKLQALIFLPLYLLFAVIELSGNARAQQKQYVVRILFGCLIAVLLQCAFFIPFAQSGVQIVGIVWQKSASSSQYVTFNADNFWMAIGVKTQSALDTQFWLLGIPYHTWGWLFFFLSSMSVLIPIAGLAVFLKKKIVSFSDRDRLLLMLISAYLISLCFFLFPTQIHERYVHPAIPLICALVVLETTPVMVLLCVLTSIAYVINLDLIMKFLISPSIVEAWWLHHIAAFIYLVAFVLGVGKLWWLSMHIWKKAKMCSP